MAGVPDDQSCLPLFKEFNILTLPCKYIYQIALYTHLHVDRFERKEENNKHSLRSNVLKKQLVIPFHELTRSDKSGYIAGPPVYNRLPRSIRDAASTALFKKYLKKWLADNQFYSFKDFLDLPIVV